MTSHLLIINPFLVNCSRNLTTKILRQTACLDLTKRSNRYIRSLLVEAAAWVAVKSDMALQAYYRKHAAKEPNKAIIKVAHKLLSRIRSVVITGVPYQTGLVKYFIDSLIQAYYVGIR